MKISRSIENYCQNPVSADQVVEINELLRVKGVLQYKVQCVTVLAAVALFCAIFYFIFDGFTWLNTLALGWCILMEYLVFTIINEEFSPHRAVNIKIHGVEMVGSLRALETDQEEPIMESLGSPLAKQLLENLQSQGRKMFVFERNLINKLVEV